MGKTVNCVDVLEVEKRRTPSKHYVYVIEVKWSDGSVFTIYRRYSRFFDLQTTLLDNFPLEGGTVDPNKRVIPFLPGKIFFGRSHIKDVAMKRLGEINTYCKKLITLPAHIAQCDEVTGFFEVEPDDLDPPKTESKAKGPKEKKVEKISKPKKLECFVAVADYQAQENGELSLLPGLKVEVLEKSETGWWFVNSEDEQGWVPCTYLEPEDGSEMQQAARAESGKEEVFVCITDFEATNDDEITLEKGVAVAVLQKNVDGWFLIRYQGTEGYAPGTCLKKANNAQRMSMMQKSRFSGVEIISSLQDVSTLLNNDKPEETKRDRSPVSQKNDRASVFVKQRSLERGGSFRPPPRHNSIKRVPVPNTPKPVRGVYVTIDDFEGNIEDGLSFKRGEKVVVKEKNPTGWWFVKTNEEEGWVPASYLEPYCGNPNTDSMYQLASMEDDFSDDDEFDNDSADNEDNNEDEDDNDWYAQPDEAFVSPVPLKKHQDIQKRPLPKIPSQEDDDYQKADGYVSASIRKPITSRDLPPPPAPPMGKKNEESTQEASHRPPPLAFGKKKEEPSGETSTPQLPSFPIGKKKEDTPQSASTPPKVMSTSTGNLNQPGDSDMSNSTSDLAAMLKAKFESRSTDAGNKPQKGNLPAKPAKATKLTGPMLPTKPSDVKKPVPAKPDPVVTPGVKPSSLIQDKQNRFSKPPPPVKVKAAMPARAGSQDSTEKEETPKTPLKPFLKPASTAAQEKSASSILFNSPDAKQKPVKPIGSVANRLAAFNQPAASAPVKPKIMAKPAKPAKPVKPSKPNITTKPQVPVKAGQKVSNLANNLNSKLNFQPSQVPMSAKNSSVKQESRDNNNQSEIIPEKYKISSNSSSQTADAPTSENSYIALFGFEAENEGEITFNEGDELELIEYGDEWSYIRVWDEEGWAPTSYLDKS